MPAVALPSRFFNDPFDTQLQLSIGCTLDDIANEIEPHLSRLVFSDTPLPEAMNDGLKRVLTTVRPLARLTTPEQIMDGLRSALRSSGSGIEAAIADAQRQWLDYVNGMRVVCVSERRDDLLMWAH